MALEGRSEKFWSLLDRRSDVKQVTTGFEFTEGPVFSRLGYLLFSDIPADKVLKWERGQLSTLRTNSNKANGLTFDHQGRLLMAEGGGRVTRMEKNGDVTTLAQEGLRAPNDLVYAIDGSVYFTDLPKGRLYQLTRERSGVHGTPTTGQLRAVAESAAPNGVALSPNQQQIYMADAKTNSVSVYAIQSDGRLGPATSFASLRVDGLKTDEGGNVWMACGDGVYVFDAGGQHLGTIRLPESPSNCCWGEGFRGLYITARKSVYHIPTIAAGTRTF